MAEIIYSYEYWIKNKSKKWFRKGYFKVMNDAAFGKNYEKCEKTQRYQIYSNKQKKEAT